MLFALGAASSAIDLLSPLTRAGKTGKASGPSPFDSASNTTSTNNAVSSPAQISPGQSSAGGTLSPDTFSSLLALSQDGSQLQAPQSRSTALKNLFSSIDSDGNGQISKSEFEANLGAGGTNVKAADRVFAELDKDGSDSVSVDELSSALKGAKRHGHHHHSDGAGGADEVSRSGSLLQALQGASSTSSSNSDGSRSTTVTYADGSKVTLTSPASSTSGSSAASSYNFVEQLIQSQAKALSNKTASISA